MTPQPQDLAELERQIAEGCIGNFFEHWARQQFSDETATFVDAALHAIPGLIARIRELEKGGELPPRVSFEREGSGLAGARARIAELESDNASLMSLIAKNQGIYRERVADLEKERDAAVLAEREECAKVCDEASEREYRSLCTNSAAELESAARAIRSRTTPGREKL